MTNLIDDRISCEFRSHFKRLLNEGKNLNFDELFERIINYLEVTPSQECQQALKRWYGDMANQSFLQDLIGDGHFEELILFGQKHITKDGIEQHAIALSDEDLILAFTQLAFNHEITWNHAHPFASFAVNFNQIQTRVTLVHPNCSADQQMRAFIRTHGKKDFQVSDFCQSHVADLLTSAVADKKNIVVVGATQSGKTTLMGCLLQQIPNAEHVIVLEDTHELKRVSQNTTAMLADPLDPKRSLHEYCAMALRMSPDRIVLGEIRSREVVPLILAFNSGHRGGLTSLHAENVVDAIERLALLFHLYSGSNQLPHNKVVELICRNIDCIVMVKNKQVTEIANIIGAENGRCLYETQWDRNLNETKSLEQDTWWKKASGH